MNKDFSWITACIESCTNKFQLDCCRTLIDLFEEKHKDENKIAEWVSNLLQLYSVKEAFIFV